ncbi:Leucine-rich repeat protein kinase family protein [Zea mays]|uniref:non-specific serine/threonine protein kinase n=1 Tax=Zea mays TaxID=4577 RepID=A0A1D6M6R0_MAIZE|nr:Leucine-rich repeat protein kinase family protein [Zea mays]
MESVRRCGRPRSEAGLSLAPGLQGGVATSGPRWRRVARSTHVSSGASSHCRPGHGVSVQGRGWSCGHAGSPRRSAITRKMAASSGAGASPPGIAGDGDRSWEEFPNAVSTGLSKAALGSIFASTIAGAILLSVVATTLIVRRRSRHRTVSKRSLSRFSVKVDGVRCFTFEEMAIATNNFDLSAQVGQGGYGKVYKGILGDGALVAIKRAHEDSLQAKSKRPLSFGLRLKIALGAAKGILYLHTEADPPIFHRDVKASNILLDSKFVAKVADFGLSRLAPVPDVEGTLPAHVSTVVKGTPGYLDPEYFLTHKLTDKSDVYSLGVVFLEMLTGMKPIEHGKNIVREVNSACQSGAVSGIIDGRMGLYPPECIKRFLSLATKCCQDETDDRPSMWEIVRELELILRMMPEEDLILLETSETDSTDVSKSLSSSATRTLFVSSQASGSLDASSGMISGRVTPR